MPAESNQTPPPAGRGSTPSLRLALVNNMPRSARAETARDLLSLVAEAPGGGKIEVGNYELTASDVDLLIAAPPDLLIVTGSEPLAPRLTDEAYWPELVRLLRWAPSATSAMLLSCLTAHAYLALTDGIERVRLPIKCHGAFRNDVRAGHPLTEGLPASMRVPHSRSNGVPAELVGAAGWEIHLRSPDAGWTVASRLEGDCRVVLAQGHPEYGTEALLREHRRDVRRYLTGERLTCPPPPVDYLGADGLRAVSDHCAALGTTPPSDPGPYPFDLAAASIVNDWRIPAMQLIGNWLADAERRSSLLTGR